MTLFRILLAFLLGLLQIFAQEGQNESTISSTNSIHVTITNIQSEEGKIVLGLYDSEENFDMKKSLQGVFVKIENGKAEVTLENVPNGVYAVLCYHDSNDNNQLDFEGFMPSEDYGASNNPIIFGPPTFKATSFKLENETKNIEIKF